MDALTKGPKPVSRNHYQVVIRKADGKENTFNCASFVFAVLTDTARHFRVWHVDPLQFHRLASFLAVSATRIRQCEQHDSHDHYFMEGDETVEIAITSELTEDRIDFKGERFIMMAFEELYPHNKFHQYHRASPDEFNAGSKLMYEYAEESGWTL